MEQTDKQLKIIEKNFNIFRQLCAACLNDRAEAVLKMVDELADRIAICPASGRTEYHNAFPGGLVDHSLRVLRYAKKLAPVLNINTSQETLVLTALFHDFGKLGDLDGDYYMPQNSDWHRDKGMMYEYRDSCKFFANAQGSLFWLQYYQIVLTDEEYLAILLHDGLNVEGNRTYSMREPKLALLLSHADRWACIEEKEQQ